MSTVKPDDNAWSKYQMLVMQQLEDYGTVLQNINAELSKIRESFKVLETQTESWKEINKNDILGLKGHIENVEEQLEDFSKKFFLLEKELELEKRISAHEKSRARWLLFVSLLIAVLNVVAIFLKK